MYARDNSYGTALCALFLIGFCIFSVFAAPCPVCSKWEGQAFHDAQVTKGGRCKTGAIPRGCVPSLNKSEDYCIQCRVAVRYNTPSGYRRCQKCYGKGEIPDKIESPKVESDPTKSTDTHLAQEAKGNRCSSDQPVVLVSVNKCDTCDDSGKTLPMIDCSMCENGFNHRKDGIHSNAVPAERLVPPALFPAVSLTVQNAAVNVKSRSTVHYVGETRLLHRWKRRATKSEGHL